MCSCHILAKYVLVSNLIVCATIKVLQVRIQQYMNWEPPDVQTEFRKGRGTTDQIASICWIIEKTRQFQKTSTSASFTTLKPLTLWITTNCEKILKEAGIPDQLICLLRNLHAGISLRTVHGTMNWFKIGKGVKAVYCHPAWKKVKVTQSCPTLYDPMDYTVHGIIQARLMEWVSVPFSRGPSQPRDQTQVSHIAGRLFISWIIKEAKEYWSG